MNQLRMVERLRKKANVSYEEARDALEKCNWNLLDALIDLEKLGKVKSNPAEEQGQNNSSAKGDLKASLNWLWNAFCRLFRKGNANSFVINNKWGNEILSMPVTVLVLLFFISWPIVLIALLVGLLVGGRYSFRGPDASKKVNDAMDHVADMAERMKNEK